MRVISVINGTLGDKSFFDSAQRGMDAIADEYDIEIDTVELGIDPANWEPGLLDVMADTDSYDILISAPTRWSTSLRRMRTTIRTSTSYFTMRGCPTITWKSASRAAPMSIR